MDILVKYFIFKMILNPLSEFLTMVHHCLDLNSLFSLDSLFQYYFFSSKLPLHNINICRLAKIGEDG